MQEIGAFLIFIIIFIIISYYVFLDKKHISDKSKKQAIPYKEIEEGINLRKNFEVQNMLTIKMFVLVVISLVILVLSSILTYFFVKQNSDYVYLLSSVLICLLLYKYMVGFINKYAKNNFLNKTFKVFLILIVIGLPLFAISKTYQFEVRFYIYLIMPIIWYFSMKSNYLIYGFLTILGILIVSEVSYRLDSSTIEFVLSVNIGTSISVSGITGLLIDISKDKKQKKEIETARLNCLGMFLFLYEEMWHEYKMAINKIVPELNLSLEEKIKKMYSIKNLFKKKIWKESLDRVEEFYAQISKECIFLKNEELFLMTKGIFSRDEISILSTINYRYTLLKDSIDKKDNLKILDYFACIINLYNESLYEEFLEEIKNRGHLLRKDDHVNFRLQDLRKIN